MASTSIGFLHMENALSRLPLSRTVGASGRGQFEQALISFCLRFVGIQSLVRSCIPLAAGGQRHEWL
jgi:hypothetical protein